MIITFEEYKKAWFEKSGISDDLNSLTKGLLFGQKLLLDYLDLSEGDDDFYHLDGSGDGGIDIAYLKRAEFNDETNEEDGDNWYLVQSKYGTSYKGYPNLFLEIQKILNTLEGQTPNLSHKTKDFVEKINHFKQHKNEKDKITIIFATENQLNELDKKQLENLFEYVKSKYGNFISLKAISLHSIYENHEKTTSNIKIELKAKLTNPVSDGRVLSGAVKLIDFYEFLKAYQRETGDIDRIYDKNIRRFLGFRGKINNKIKETLLTNPENFGLYNNGVTFIVKDYRHIKDNKGNNSYKFFEPYIVNGCQTASTIWEVINNKDKASSKQEWKNEFEKGVVIIKVAKIEEDYELLENITRFTNTQNAIKDKDFIALNSDLNRLKTDLAKNHNVFLEIQRGGWASQLAFQNKKQTNEFEKESWANIFDLLKVYGAGWLGRAGDALNKNSMFAPGGVIFREIIKLKDDNLFSCDDLFVAYNLYKIVENKTNKKRLRSTKFMFYRIVIELFKPILNDLNHDYKNNFIITQGLINLIEKPEIFKLLTEQAFQVIEQYLNDANSNSYLNEPTMQQFKDFNSFIKNSRIFNNDYSPKLNTLIEFHKQLMNYRLHNEKTKFETIKEAISGITKYIEPINPACLYAQKVLELNELSSNAKLKWTEICSFLGIDPGNSSAREYLKRWVRKNKPDWEQVI